MFFRLVISASSARGFSMASEAGPQRREERSGIVQEVAVQMHPVVKHAADFNIA